jgi:hypothetical protein
VSECGHQVYGSVCQVVDPMYLKVEQMVGMTLPLIVNKYVGLLVAIAFFPVLAIAIPFLVVACTIGLPIFLPIVIVSAMLFIFNGLIILSLLAISPPGRSRLIEPFVEGLKKDEVGKKLLYTKYPMPTVTELVGKKLLYTKYPMPSATDIYIYMYEHIHNIYIYIYLSIYVYVCV